MNADEMKDVSRRKMGLPEKTELGNAELTVDMGRGKVC